jgi:hypothetical protein
LKDPKSREQRPIRGEVADDDVKDGKPDQKPEESKNGYVTAMNSRASTTSCSKNTSMTGLAVVPVKVRAKGGNKMVETYAFLDNGSNTTFCTERLINQLGLEGTKSTLSLTTLETANSITDCSIVNL